MEMQAFKVRVKVESKPADDTRDWREDAIVVSVRAKDETQAVSIVGQALTRLVTPKAFGSSRVYETI